MVQPGQVWPTDPTEHPLHAEAQETLEGLTRREQLFALALCDTGCKAEAARAAGYRGKYPSKWGQRTYAKPRVHNAILEIMRALNAGPDTVTSLLVDMATTRPRLATLMAVARGDLDPDEAERNGDLRAWDLTGKIEPIPREDGGYMYRLQLRDPLEVMDRLISILGMSRRRTDVHIEMDGDDLSQKSDMELAAEARVLDVAVVGEGDDRA